ncbi:asparagine synthase B [Succinatimonas hippei]|uniref:asparagine synthase (glutamine-hydrolyzing) n=1 Tax=Succinatimonas hippei (strain DSM 22608 / JCM 16073 / KCTC 15190 / YIT 12066) TaxID=762983 RepID=E8LLJ2_SUCHY|nr:asparagine synthase B [Succinatimonas hippei]EFY06612.1 asparagine synthase (glutamine-hydrolyzing) [Succinatimonas hippei YIT 12066]MDM8121000.1 asparagine synthase B [Succinatimonas hippei]
MCSIFGILDIKEHPEALRRTALEMSRRQLHRGPDWEGIYQGEKAIVVHERLSIVDPSNGAQPLYNDNRTHVLAANGEIYNHKQLKSELTIPYNFKTGSDCEVILALYEEFKQTGKPFLDRLIGDFAFLIYDAEDNTYFIARDHMGIVPVYVGSDNEGRFYVASEMKALTPVCDTVKEFPPGSYLYSKEDREFHRYYKRDWMEYDNVKDNKTSVEDLKNALMDSVKRQLMCDVPYGVLLSGGLDSSVISAIAKHFAERRVEDDGKTEAWFPRLHSFAIGLEGAPDLKKARVVADYLGTVHHEIHYTIEEGIDALRDVIYHIETYDVTTIRASTPMYLMARYIKAMGIKMVLSGEGSDEIFGGYLYFHKAPNAKEFHEELVRKLSQLHLYDCLRANKSLMAWGVEGRVPFLDKKFLDVAMHVNPQDKMCPGKTIEKKVLREAFEGMLPSEVLWRQKEQFSDGVGYSWIDALRDYAEKQVSDRKFAERADRFPVNTPVTKEAYLYREIFEELFKLPSAVKTVPYGKSVACSTETAIAWDEKFKNMADPSGRAVTDIHDNAYEMGHKL